MINNDVLSDVFSSLRLSSGVYFQARLSGNFSVELPQELRRVRFHLVRHGQCWIGLHDKEPIALMQGDLAIVPNGMGQILCAAPGTPPRSLPEILSTGALSGGVLIHGTGDSRTDLLCGFCQVDKGIDHPLLANLPALMVLRPDDLGVEPWTIATLRLLAMEADLNAQGTNGILGRLLEIVFVQAVRRLATAHDLPANGFIAALSDPNLSKALLALHAEPENAWTVSDLASAAGMSRARFADRFTTLVGQPPIGYLTAWRLIRSRYLLTNSDMDMAEIADRCGYASVPSFSRRFKAQFGIGPGAYRRSSNARRRS